MPTSQPILIACPALRRVVRGRCAADESGRCRRGADGSFPLSAVTCGQDGGRCGETLCALHRYNRRGPGTWYPDRVWALRTPPAGRNRDQPRPTGGSEGMLCIDA
jgi:hypothetical protein